MAGLVAEKRVRWKRWRRLEAICVETMAQRRNGKMAIRGMSSVQRWARRDGGRSRGRSTKKTGEIGEAAMKGEIGNR